MSTKSKTNKSRGFTLTEILVVIGIVILLAAILFPAFSAIRRKSQMTSCSSNLHQIYVATSLYASDNNGFLPPYPTRVLGGFANGSDYPEQSRELLAGLSPYLQAKAVWICPADNSDFDPNVRTYSSQFRVYHVTSYEYRGYDISLPPLAMSPLPMRIDLSGSRIERLIERSVINDYPLFEDNISSCNNTQEYSDYNHGGRQNFLYSDGHVKAAPSTPADFCG